MRIMQCTEAVGKQIHLRLGLVDPDPRSETAKHAAAQDLRDLAAE